jgi:hypothetical protein
MPRPTAPDTLEPRSPVASPTLQRELHYALAGLAFGAGILPILVYAAGAATLGPYDGGLQPFLGTLYGDLAHGAPGAIALVLGPYALFQVLRVVSRPLRHRED